jgi:hypothetical protein
MKRSTPGKIPKKSLDEAIFLAGILNADVVKSARSSQVVRYPV